ncbi:MAG: hypothetical protein WKF82_02815 [Nocardioidaceae bacterium]
MEVLYLPEAWRTVEQMFGRGGRQGEPATGQLRIPLSELTGRLPARELARLEKQLAANNGRITGEAAQRYIDAALKRSGSGQHTAARAHHQRQGHRRGGPGPRGRPRPQQSAAPSARARQLGEAIDKVDAQQQAMTKARESFLEQAGLIPAEGLAMGQLGRGLNQACSGLCRATNDLTEALANYRALTRQPAAAGAATPAQPQTTPIQPTAPSTDQPGPAQSPRTEPPQLSVTAAAVQQARQHAADGDLPAAIAILTQLARDTKVITSYADDPGWATADYALAAAIQALSELHRRARTGQQGPAPLTGIFARLAALVDTLPADVAASAAAAWQAKLETLLEQFAEAQANLHQRQEQAAAELATELDIPAPAVADTLADTLAVADMLLTALQAGQPNELITASKELKLAHLTERQLQVLIRYGRGDHPDQIAADLAVGGPHLSADALISDMIRALQQAPGRHVIPEAQIRSALDNQWRTKNGRGVPGRWKYVLDGLRDEYVKLTAVEQGLWAGELSIEELIAQLLPGDTGPRLRRPHRHRGDQHPRPYGSDLPAVAQQRRAENRASGVGRARPPDHRHREQRTERPDRQRWQQHRRPPTNPPTPAPPPSGRTSHPRPGRRGGADTNGHNSSKRAAQHQRATIHHHIH